MFTSSVRLSPECQKAVKVLEGAIDSLFVQTHTDLPSLDVLCSEGRLSFHRGIVTTSQLPRSKEWIWNQSRGKKTLTTPLGDKKAIFYKLNTRSRGLACPPAIKLWVFNIEILPCQQYFSILWCQKGDQVKMDYTATLTASEESFLLEHCPMTDLFPYQPETLWDIDLSLDVDLDLPFGLGSF